MKELALATKTLEKLKVLGGMGASFYVGALVGSLCVATFKVGNCGASILDAIKISQRYNIYRASFVHVWVANPGILNLSKHKFVRPMRTNQVN